MGAFAWTLMKDRPVVCFHRVHAVLLLIPCTFLLLIPATEVAAGSPLDACTLVTTTEAVTVLGGAVSDVKSQYRGQEELKRLWASLDEEQNKAARQTGLDPSSLIEEARCEYSTASDVSPADLDSSGGGSLTILIGRVRNKEEAAKAFRRTCSGEDFPTLTYKQLAGIGDGACAIGSSAIMALKNDIILSLTYVLLSAGDVVTVDIKPLVVKAVSRLP